MLKKIIYKLNVKISGDTYEVPILKTVIEMVKVPHLICTTTSAKNRLAIQLKITTS